MVGQLLLGGPQTGARHAGDRRVRRALCVFQRFEMEQDSSRARPKMGDAKTWVCGGLLISGLQVCRRITASRSCARKIKVVMCQARRSRKRRSPYSFARQTTEKVTEKPSKNDQKMDRKRSRVGRTCRSRSASRWGPDGCSPKSVVVCGE